MWKKALLTLSLCAPALATAAVEDDLERIRPYLPNGTDVAQVQASVLDGFSPREAAQAGASNYLIRDLNGDRLEDLLVISEEQPTFENYETNEPCVKGDSPDCRKAFGKRAMHFFLGGADGKFHHSFTNDHFVLGADDGGVFGDPLEGFSVRPNGTVQYSVYGGSAWRWSYSEVIQFRRGALHVIGQDSYYGWTGDLRADTKSVNLLTGQVIETKQKDGDAPVRTKRYRVAVKPLPKLATYRGQQE